MSDRAAPGDPRVGIDLSVARLEAGDGVRFGVGKTARCRAGRRIYVKTDAVVGPDSVDGLCRRLIDRNKLRRRTSAGQ